MLTHSSAGQVAGLPSTHLELVNYGAGYAWLRPELDIAIRDADQVDQDLTRLLGWPEPQADDEPEEPRYTDRDRARFAAKYQPGAPDACWPWTAARDRKGYGAFRHGSPSRQFKAHRVAWEMANGRCVPDGLSVLHRCDNPPCVNPAHLFVGTVGDNNKDRSAKGRSSQGDEHWTRARPEGLARDSRNGHATKPEATRRGTAHPRAKLTEADVVAIRAAYRDGDVNLTALAGSYGVARSTIGHIVRGESWTDCEARFLLTDLGRRALAMEALFGRPWPTALQAFAGDDHHDA